MIEGLLQSHLEPVARRHRQLRLWRSLAVCWAATALAGLFFLWLSTRFSLSRDFALGLLAVIFVAGMALTFSYVRRGRTDYRQIAREIEREHPDLHSLLITAVEQEPERHAAERGAHGHGVHGRPVETGASIPRKRRLGRHGRSGRSEA